MGREYLCISLISVQIFSLLSFRIVKIISGCSKCFFQIPGTKLRGIIFVLKKLYFFFMMKILLKKSTKKIRDFFNDLVRVLSIPYQTGFGKELTKPLLNR